MKLSERFLATLLTLVMVFTLLPGTALMSTAAGGISEVLIDAGSAWDYYYFTSDDSKNTELGLTWDAAYPEGWQDSGFDTSGWLNGNAPFAGLSYTNGSAKTVLQVNDQIKLSAAFVKTFTLSDGFSPDELKLSLFYDENPVVYLNGRQILSRSGWNGGLTEFDASAYTDLLHGGVNTVAVQMENNVNGGGFNFDLKLVANAGSTDLKLIKEKDEWQYFYYTNDADKNAALGIKWSEAPADWYKPGSDRSDWLTGRGYFVCASWPKGGYGTLIDVTDQYELQAGYAKTFTLTDPDLITGLVLELMYDQNPVVYLNGTQVYTTTGYHDSSYVTVNLNSYRNLLVKGENTLAVSMMNAVNGGGYLFAAKLTATVEPLELYDEGKAIIASASSNWAFSGSSIGAASNVYDGDPNTCCGAWMTADNYITVEFLGEVELNKIAIESKAESTTTDESGIYGHYDLYARGSDGGFTLIAFDVPSYTTAMNGEIVVLPQTVTTTAVKIVATDWYGGNWANVCEIACYKELDTATATFVADGNTVAAHTVLKGGKLAEGKIPAVPAKSGYVGEWSPAITPETVLDGDTTVTAAYTELRSFTVTFVADGVTVLERTLTAGEVFAESDYPAVPEKPYYVGSWDHSGAISGADTVITAVYTDTRTTLVTADNLSSFLNDTPKTNPFGDIGKAGNVADGNPDTIWGFGFESGMNLRCDFGGYYEISRMTVGCKKEGTPNAAGVYGLYTVTYLATDGEWKTIASDITALPTVDGGVDLSFDAVIAKAIRIYPTAWYTTDWAGIAEWQVYGLESDAKDVHPITWTDGNTTEVTYVEAGGMPIAPETFKSYTVGNVRYTLTGWTPAISEVTGAATYTAVYSEQDLSVLTITVAGDGIYNDEDEEGEDVTVLSVKLAYYNGLWAADLFEEDYEWRVTINGTVYLMTPVAASTTTGRYTFYPCLEETPFIPQASSEYTVSISVCDGDTVLYHSGEVTIETDPDFEPFAPGEPVVPTPDYDISGDGIVSIVDVTKLLIIVSNYDGEQAPVDFTGDGYCTIEDVTKILAYIALHA